MAKNSHKGFATLYLVFLTLFFMAAISASSFLLISGQQRISRNTQNSIQAYWAAEAGVEDAFLRLKNSMNWTNPISFSAGEGITSTTITETSPGTNLVVAQGNDTSRIRKIQAVLVLNATIPQFRYGVQVGQGGVIMGENSRVEGAGGAAGNFYSNGAVVGDNGATITGDVTVAGTNSIDNVVVYGTARVNSITNSKICGDAFYRSASSIDASSKSFLDSPANPTCGGNPLTPGTGFPSQPDPAVASMPISQGTIDQWKTDAAVGGTIAGNCGDSGVAGCVIQNDDTLSLGPKKITGNLVLTKKQTLVVTGTLHIQGSISMDSGSGATIKCGPSFNTTSCVIVSDSWIHVKNNSIFQGSGQSGSFVMLLTTLAGCNGGNQQPQCTHHNGAIDIHNNATGAIFYAANSLANLHNGVNISALTAYKLEFGNNVIVTYEQGLLNAQFSSGPGASWELSSWKEVE